MLYGLGPRAHRVYSALLERIRSGQLSAGTRLPPHTQLAASFAVAPLTMRQVLAQLEAEGLLGRDPGRGAGGPHARAVAGAGARPPPPAYRQRRAELRASSAAPARRPADRG